MINIMLQEWPKKAACKNSKLDFCEDKATLEEEAELKKICFVCPVRKECLKWAKDHNEPVGVWGGQNTRERSGMAKIRTNITVVIDPHLLKADLDVMSINKTAHKHGTTPSIIYRHIKQFPWIREKK